MKNYLELKVPIKKDAPWLVELRNAMDAAHIPVRWQSGSYHITAVFIYEDTHVDELQKAFSRIFDGREAPTLTLDKLDAFEASRGGDIIVNVTATKPSDAFTTLVKELRHEVEIRNADYRTSFILHITLGRIDSTDVSLRKVHKVINSIAAPADTVSIKTANYRYFRGKIVKSWKMY